MTYTSGEEGKLWLGCQQKLVSYKHTRNLHDDFMNNLLINKMFAENVLKSFLSNCSTVELF